APPCPPTPPVPPRLPEPPCPPLPPVPVLPPPLRPPSPPCPPCPPVPPLSLFPLPSWFPLPLLLSKANALFAIAKDTNPLNITVAKTATTIVDVFCSITILMDVIVYNIHSTVLGNKNLQYFYIILLCYNNNKKNKAKDNRSSIMELT